MVYIGSALGLPANGQSSNSSSSSSGAATNGNEGGSPNHQQHNHHHGHHHHGHPQLGGSHNHHYHHYHHHQRLGSPHATSSSPMVMAGSHQQDSSGEDDDREGRIRVGKDYQVSPPQYIEPHLRRPEQCPERALLVWAPSNAISNAKLDEYIAVAKEKYSYNAEQALGMLFWHKHDLDKAIQDLSNFTPVPDDWSVEDKVLFEQAFQFHGKSFHRIRQMLPDKTIAQLVKYYYGWKKTRTRSSVMDRQARKLQAQREDQGQYGEPAETTLGSDSEEKEAEASPKCFNCGIPCHVTHATPKGQMCGTCHQYYTRTGNVRPTTGPLRKDGTKSKHSLFKNSGQPPKGMYVNHDDLVSVATGPVTQADALLKSMDREIVSYKRCVQSNKQLLSGLMDPKKKIHSNAIDPYRMPESVPKESKINPKWTNEELLLGVQGIRHFGKNFKLIAEILDTKTESHVRSFFVNYRRKYNLDAALKEYESVHGPSNQQEEEEDASGSGKSTPKEPASPINRNNGISK